MPRGKHCVRTGFQTAEASALLFVFDQKKDGLAVRGQGSTQPLMPKRSPVPGLRPSCGVALAQGGNCSPEHPGGPEFASVPIVGSPEPRVGTSVLRL